MSEYSDDLLEQVKALLGQMVAAILATVSSIVANTWTARQTFAVGAAVAPVAFASLPGSPVHGLLMAVTDSNTVVWGATIAGGGSGKVLAYYNGTNWTVAGK